jgi:hypothetical protein
MKNIMLVLFAVSLIFVSNVFAQEKLGNELTLEETTAISEILSNPEKYVGQKVLVEGEVLEVCRNMGCWMDLSSDIEDQKIKIKVKDGEIVFTEEHLGKTASAEGVVYAIEMDEEDAKEYFEHMAEDAGKEFDTSSITGPVTIYQIRGSGAVIK